MKAFFQRKKKAPPAIGAGFTHVAGDVFTGGAMSWGYKPTTATTPIYSPRSPVGRRFNFIPLGISQPGGMVTQLQSLPPSLPQGFPFGNLAQYPLIDADEYSNPDEGM